MKRIVVCLFVVLVASCSSSAAKPAFVKDLQAISAQAKKMDDAQALGWGRLICTMFTNGGTRADADGNITHTAELAKDGQPGEYPLDDVNPDAAVDFAIRDLCPGFAAKAGTSSSN